MKHKQKPTAVVSDILNNYLDWIGKNYPDLDEKDLKGVFDVVYLTYLGKSVTQYSSAVKAIASCYSDNFNKIMKKYFVDKPDLLYEICMLYLSKAIEKGAM
jgi:type I restriction-modification system DNA methylase subunit